MKDLLLLVIMGCLLGLVEVKAADENIINSPVYEGHSDSAVSISRSGEWSAKNATFDSNSASWGGGINNNGYLNLYGHNVFKNNSGFWGGGAIANYGIATLSGQNVFEGNWSADRGGAIYSGWYTIIKSDDETGKSIFRNNRAYQGGAIASIEASLYVNGAEFINNRAEDTRNGKELSLSHQGGAILADGNNHYLLNSVFRENHAYAGGAILTGFAQGLLSPDTVFEGLKLYNTSFYDNKAFDNGGAITAIGAEIIAAGSDGVSEFKGNQLDNGKAEAIYMTNEYVYGAENVTPKLILKMLNGGKIIMHDSIYGKDYDIDVIGGISENVTDEVIDDEDLKEEIGNVLSDVIGDGGGEFYLLGSINDAENFNVSSGATVHLGTEAVINTENYISDNGTLKLDMAVDAASQVIENGIINVNGDVVGNTKVIVNAETPDVFDGAKTEFVNAANFEGGKAEQFEVARVIGSPYMWRSVVNAGGEETGSHWYLSLTDEKNSDFQFAPEIGAYVGLQSAAVEQNRSIANSVAKGISYKKSSECYQETCGVAEIMPQKQAWVDVTYENAEIDTPADMDAKINGTTLGVDLYREGDKRAGVFGAYRHGKYDLSGKGKYYSALESDITNKSYLGGAYYQFDNNDVRLIGTAFIGKQDMDIKTFDGFAKADTDVMQYGASVEAAKQYEINERLSLEPSLGLYYTMLDVDDLQDNVGKTAKFDILHYLEVELGLKAAYVFCHDGSTNKVYAKPSVIRTFAHGATTHISGLERSVKSYESRTLGRMELGGEFGLSSKWSGYVTTGYTFGDGYKSYDVNAGVGYRF